MQFRKPFVIGASAAVLLVVAIAVTTLTQSARPSISRGSMGLTAGSGEAGSPAMYVKNQGATEEAAYDSSDRMMIAPSVTMPSPVPMPPTAGETAAEVDQKIIKNGSIRMTVEDVYAASDRITALATAKGGFVQGSSSSERGDGTHEGYVTVRVPAKHFESTMTEIKAFAKLVRNDSTNSQDVTEQYTDLEAQLRNAKKQEETYLAVLDKADSVEDILRVQERLGSIRGVIESLEGRKKYLENVTSYSTISVSLEEEPVVRLPTKEFRPAAMVKEAVQALVGTFQNFAAALIWIVIVGGGIALPLVILGLIVRAVMRRMKKQ
jgi:hypothetical protein